MDRWPRKTSSPGHHVAIAATLLALSGCQAAGLIAPTPGVADAVPGELLVKFRSSTPEADRDALRAAYPITRREDILTDTEHWVLASETQASVDKLQASTLVEYAQPNYVRHVQAFSAPERAGGATYNYFRFASAFPDSPSTAPTNQWYLGATRGIDVDSAWSYLTSQRSNMVPGAGVLVAVVDTGIDFNHPDLVSRIATDSSGVKRFYDEVGPDNYLPTTGQDFTGADGNGHGTHVSGLIAATANNGGLVGVAPGATLLPVKVMRSDGGGDDAAIAKGLRDAANAGADVINLSVGGSEPSQTLANALAYDMAHGVTVVIASGNGYQTDHVYYPAAYAGVICVGATSGVVGSPHAIPSYSNRGPEMTLVAPGGDTALADDAHGILSCLPTYQYYMSARSAKPLQYGSEVGTSMATPLVAGVAALIISDARAQGIHLTPSQVRERLIATATPLSTSPFTLEAGYGLVNPLRALQWSHPGGNTP